MEVFLHCNRRLLYRSDNATSLNNTHFDKLSPRDVNGGRFRTTDDDDVTDGDAANDETVFVASVKDGDVKGDGVTNSDDDGSDTASPCECEVVQALIEQVSMATAVVAFAESSLTGDDDEDDDDSDVVRGKFSWRTFAAGDVEKPLVFAAIK